MEQELDLSDSSPSSLKDPQITQHIKPFDNQVLRISGAIIIFFIGIFLIPFPYFQQNESPCKPSQINCPANGWHLAAPLGTSLTSFLLNSTNSQSRQIKNTERVYSDKSACEQQTKKQCILRTCDVFKETIPEKQCGIKSHWTPIPDSTSTDQIANWETYRVEAADLFIRLPPILSDSNTLQTFESSGQKGTSFCSKLIRKTSLSKHIVYAGDIGCFPSSDDLFLLGGVTNDYEAGREGAFTDLNGFIKQNGKYFAKLTLGRTSEIPAELVKEIINPSGIAILIIQGKSGINPSREFPQGFSLFGTLGNEWVGALVNTNNSKFPGFALQMRVAKDLTNQVFQDIVSTITFLDPSVGSFTCPKTGWVNCMPILSNEAKKYCSKNALVWYKENCPNFQGVAQ